MTIGEATGIVLAVVAIGGMLVQHWRGGTDASGQAAAKWKELSQNFEDRLTRVETENGRYRAAFDFLCSEVMHNNPTAVRVARSILDGKIVVTDGI